MTKQTASHICELLVSIVRQRSRHYDAARRSNRYPVPHELRKRKAIDKIWNLAQAARSYSPEQVARLVHVSLREDIQLITPSRNSRYKKLRNTLAGMLDYCRNEYYSHLHATHQIELPL